MQRKAFPPLKEVRQTLQVTWYRCPVGKGKLGPLMQRSDAQGLFQALGHLCIWTCTGYTVYAAWLAEMYVAMLGLMILHGTVGSCFVYGCHELGHGTVFKTKTLNSLFLTIFSFLFWWDPVDYAMSHTYHHRYSQFPDGDRENVFPLEPSLDPYLMFELFTCNVTSVPGRVFGKGGMISCIYLTCKAAMGGIAAPSGTEQEEWLAAVRKDQPAEVKRSMQFSQGVVLGHALVCAASILTGQWVFILIINLSPFFGNWYSYFVGSTQHCGLRGSVPDFRKNTRTIVLDPFSEFLFWRMNWHCEHHMFANVPCYNLAELHKEVAHDMPTPRTLVGAWKEMRATWNKQQEDPDYEFDTPVPAPSKAKTDAMEAQRKEAGHLGDIAPATL